MVGVPFARITWFILAPVPRSYSNKELGRSSVNRANSNFWGGEKKCGARTCGLFILVFLGIMFWVYTPKVRRVDGLMGKVNWACSSFSARGERALGKWKGWAVEAVVLMDTFMDYCGGTEKLHMELGSVRCLL